MRWRARRDRDVDEDLLGYLDGSLRARRRRRLEDRLESNADLREALHAMRRIREAARSDEPESDPQDFDTYYGAIANRIRRPNITTRRSIRWRWAVPVAATAIAAAVVGVTLVMTSEDRTQPANSEPVAVAPETDDATIVEALPSRRFHGDVVESPVAAAKRTAETETPVLAEEVASPTVTQSLGRYVARSAPEAMTEELLADRQAGETRTLEIQQELSGSTAGDDGGLGRDPLEISFLSLPYEMASPDSQSPARTGGGRRVRIVVGDDVLWEGRAEAGQTITFVHTGLTYSATLRRLEDRRWSLESTFGAPGEVEGRLERLFDLQPSDTSGEATSVTATPDAEAVDRFRLAQPFRQRPSIFIEIYPADSIAEHERGQDDDTR